MTETSFSKHRPLAPETALAKAEEGLVNATLLDHEERDAVASRWSLTVEYGYPVPTGGRDAALELIQPWLESRDIYSRGRFGGWKYETGNMDHSVMQGVEWADRMVRGATESTYTIRR